MSSNTSQDYISFICSLYGSSYDDRIENTSPPTAGDMSRDPGADWVPGAVASHKSLISFQRELKQQGINLSTSKIKKILITGGLWTTEASRTIQALYSSYTAAIEDGVKGLSPDEAIKRIAAERGISVVTVNVNLPYMSVVYNLPTPSANAQRCRRWKERQAASRDAGVSGVAAQRAAAVEDLQAATAEDWKEKLWRCICSYEGAEFHTSGRGSKPGVAFSYSVSRNSGAGGGRRYDGPSVEGFGNELWVTTNPNSPDTWKLKKSISRSTVELGYKRAREMGGVVKGPKALGLPGAGSYVFILLREFGVIKEQGA
jgi:hypothetical protein